MNLLSSKYSSGTRVKYQLFTSSGTWTKPAKFIEGSLLVTGSGGGASGMSTSTSGTAAGGNAGEWCYERYTDVSAISSATVTIGTGGASVSNDTNANSGGVTSFGALVVLSGGIGALTISGKQAASVGGAYGGLIQSYTTTAKGMIAANNPSAVGGNGGYNFAGNFQITINSGGVETSSGNVGGGGGIVLDSSGVKGGDTAYATGGIGYGAGGAGGFNEATGAGASGVIFLMWQETA